MSCLVGTAIQTKLGTDMIRPEGMSRPKGAAMSRPEMEMPGTDMICKPEGMNRPAGTAMQTKPGSDMTCNTIRAEGTSRPTGTAMQTEPGTDMAPLAAASVQGTLPSRQQVFGER
jgi:hypothetical protein